MLSYPLHTRFPATSCASKRRHRAHRGQILAQAAALAEGGELRPFLNEERFFASEINAAHASVASGSLGKVVVEF